MLRVLKAMIVAINKIDKAEANTEKVKNELMGLEIIPEEWRCIICKCLPKW